MRLKALPGDFAVTEHVSLNLVPSGPWAVYRVRKVGLATLDLQTELAQRLGLRREQVVFPALKDKDAIAEQFLTLPASAPATLEGEGYRAERVGFRRLPLSGREVSGNVFRIIVRDLSEQEALALARRLPELAQTGLPNYYDAQRFGSFARAEDEEGAHIGKAILKRDASAALRAYLTTPFLGDPRPVRRFKHQAAALWPDWRAIMAVAPRPSNFRSVLTFLIDHPEEHRKALNLIPQRLLALYLAAYQSRLWNRIAAAFLEERCRESGLALAWLDVAGERLPLSLLAPETALPSWTAEVIALPEHRARFASPQVAGLAQRVLQEEGLAQEDLKARVLQKAYLARGGRALWLRPESLSVSSPAPDERFAHRFRLETLFALPRGSYATLVIKAAATS